MSAKHWLAAVVMLSSGSRLAAQTVDLTIPPNNILPNYNRVSIGQREGLEAGAFVARTDDAAANWFNPAGLALSEKSAINASANAYEVTRLSLVGLGATTSGTRFSAIGSFFGGVLGSPVIESRKWRIGFGYTKPIHWSPSALDAAFDGDAAGARQTFAYASTVDFTTVIPGVAAALRLSERFRAGAGISYGLTGLTQNQTVTERLVFPGAAATNLRSFATDGTVHSLFVSGGAQWDVSRRVTVGALLVSPALRLGGSTKLLFETSTFGNGSTDLSFRDDHAHFAFRIPMRATIGAAYRFGRGDVEVDVRYHGSEAEYELLSSDVPGRLVTTGEDGVPVVEAVAFTPVRHRVKSVVSVAVGGNYALSQKVRLHAGAFTDPSPVALPPRSIFRAVDLVGASGGVSLSAGSLSGSIGMATSWGTTSGRQVGPAAGGLSTLTKIKIRTINLLYSISYRF